MPEGWNMSGSREVVVVAGVMMIDASGLAHVNRKQPPLPRDTFRSHDGWVGAWMLDKQNPHDSRTISRTCPQLPTPSCTLAQNNCFSSQLKKTEQKENTQPHQTWLLPWCKYHHTVRSEVNAVATRSYDKYEFCQNLHQLQNSDQGAGKKADLN